RIELGLLDLEDVDEHLATRRLLQLLPELVDLRPLAADDDARARGVDVDLQLVRRALDFDPRHTGVHEPLLEVIAQDDVLVPEPRVVLVGERTRPPGLVEAEPEPEGMYPLTHSCPLLFCRRR